VLRVFSDTAGNGGGEMMRRSNSGSNLVGAASCKRARAQACVNWLLTQYHAIWHSVVDVRCAAAALDETRAAQRRRDRRRAVGVCVRVSSACARVTRVCAW
jgi:hypothetical protein